MGLISQYKHLLKGARDNRLIRNVMILNMVIKGCIVCAVANIIGLVILFMFAIPITANILYLCSSGAAILCLLQLPADVANDVRMLEQKSTKENELL